jgi:hypothetical protein
MTITPPSAAGAKKAVIGSTSGSNAHQEQSV